MIISRIFIPLFAFVGLALGAPAPILNVVTETIGNSFIVVLKPLSDSAFLDFLAGRPADIISATESTFNTGSFKGFSGIFPASLLDILRALTEVKYIEPNSVVKVSALTTQTNAPWGLARISHRDLGSTSYVFDSNAGSDTFAYLLDTGIYVGHKDFEGRATFGANFVDNDNTDGNGHGTHVAGTIGSKTYGVAKNTNLIAVKVLSAQGSGALSGIISGLQWIVADAKAKSRIGKAVVNMSLGGTYSQASNDAVAAAVKEGLFIGVAAGNDGRSASLTSPASEPSVCTVGATDKNDALASYSNYGSGVDILAPGNEILSTWIRSDTDTNTISGTSMATPHVVGLAAYLLGLEGPQAPGPLCERIKMLSTKNKISLGLAASLFLTPNSLAYNGNGA